MTSDTSSEPYLKIGLIHTPPMSHETPKACRWLMPLAISHRYHFCVGKLLEKSVLSNPAWLDFFISHIHNRYLLCVSFELKSPAN